MRFSDIFTYKSGEVFWNGRPESDFSKRSAYHAFNKMVGNTAGYLDKSNGYWYVWITIGGIEKKIPRSHIVWCIHNNAASVPKGFVIDHINHVRDDDRIENLELKSYRGNNRNLSISKRNKSGCVGVTWYSRDEMWMACIMGDDGKNKNLGRYNDWFDAVCARKSAEHELGYHTNHGKDSENC